ncbi:MAG: hypothetical protein Q7S08_00595 [bacterium]|nr:hypothetical protein [bacterium]
MSTTYPAWIDEYAEALYSSFQNHDVKAHMPFSGWDFYPLFADLWIDKLDKAIATIRMKGVRIESIVEQLPNHASMKFKLSEVILCLKSAHTTPLHARNIVDFFLEAIKVRTLGEPLWLNNKIRLYKDVGSVIKDKKLVPANRELASEIGKIITGCATLAHGLYNDFCPDLAYDVYGPYDTSGVYGKGTSLVVRSFGDLNPVELWPEHAPQPYKKVEVFSIYHNVQMRPTYVACQMIYEQNLLDNLVAFQVEVDGKSANVLGELKSVRDKLLKSASELYVEYQGLGFEKQKEFWLYQLGYQLKTLFDITGHDWRPSQETIERVRGKKLIPTVETYNISRGEFYEKFGIEYLKTVYDVA